MVKVSGPMFSMSAAGTLGDAITFAQWKGRAYVRERVKPANPKSDKQLSVRAMLQFLSTDWNQITSGDKATWNAMADADVVSAFNAYIGANLKSWRNFQGVSEVSTFARSLANGTAGVATAIGGVRMATVTMPFSANIFTWCVLFFRKTGSAVTPAFDNLVACLHAEGTADVVYVDTPLEPATYHYNFMLCTVDGVLELEDQAVNAVVTA